MTVNSFIDSLKLNNELTRYASYMQKTSINYNKINRILKLIYISITLYMKIRKAYTLLY